MFTETDYDKLRQIMAESPEKKELLTKLLASQKLQLSTVSHEIRNPLTLVYSILQMIESEHPEALNFRHWDTLHDNIEYMKLLLEELSSYNNGEHLSLEPINLNSLLKTLVLSFAVSIVDTDIIFTSDIQPDLPIMEGDCIKLKGVILNLLKNAKDAVSISSTSRTPSIILHAYTEHISNSSTQFVVTIQDNGCGMTPEIQQTIFEPFITYKKNGTGLGLAVSKKIAQAHGGTLTVDSTPCVGTVFTLTLPI